MKARFYRCDGEDVICGLCPRRCRIAPGKRGACLGRMNRNGELCSLVYGAPVAVQVEEAAVPYICRLLKQEYRTVLIRLLKTLLQLNISKQMQD